jgi:hypothetical protein
MGVTPPPANPSCGCFPQPRTITTSTTSPTVEVDR